MAEAGPLQSLLEGSAARHPDSVAVKEPGGLELRYRELDALASRVRDRLRATGVGPGDRVALYMRKSVDTVAALFGTLKAGAAYVPIDSEAPAERCGYIMADCQVQAAFVEQGLVDELKPVVERHGHQPAMLPLDFDAEAPLKRALDRWDDQGAAPETRTASSQPGDLAYILYTSGSTGRPKGVMLSHRAARCFIDWCSGEFAPGRDDVYSSHAPLHFDLSIHDVFVPIKHGARLVLIDNDLGKDPMRLAQVLADEGITVWYSTPSILNLLASFGKLDRLDVGALRLVLFAGEVFPVPQLRELTTLLPGPRYYNLYGPTETNVCTYYEIPLPVPEERVDPYPIGRMCPPLRGRVLDAEGEVVAAGTEGELVVAGPGVMDGYWNLTERNEAAFIRDDAGVAWYRTGDLVVEDVAGEYIFHGRRDRMVKRRGYRIELGEIEAGLSRHPGIAEVAVVADEGPRGVRIRAFVAPGPDRDLGVIGLKRYSAEVLPRYMVPDTFEFLEALPRTSTDKIDYQALLRKEPLASVQR